MADFLKDSLLELESYKSLLEILEGKENKILASHGVIRESLGHLVFSISRESKKKILLLTEDEGSAMYLHKDLLGLGHENVELYPRREMIFYDIEATSQENTHQRIKVMSKLLDEKEKDLIVVASIGAVLDKIMSKDIFKDHLSNLSLGQSLDLEVLKESLISLGYERVNRVEAIGQYSIKGGIIDIATIGYENPFRIELFGDEIDTIREFDISSQRSLNNVENFKLMPVKEIIFESEKKNKIIENIRKDLDKSRENKKALDKFSEYIEKINQDLRAKNNNLLIPYLDEEDLTSIVTYFDKEGLIIVNELKRMEENWEKAEEIFHFKIADLFKSGEILSKHSKIYYSMEDILGETYKNTIIYNSDILIPYKDIAIDKILDFSIKPTIHYQDNLEVLVNDLNNYIDMDYRIVILARSEERGKRLESILKDHAIRADFTKSRDKELLKKHILITPGYLQGGFEYNSIKLVIISDRQVFTERKKTRKKKTIKGEKIVDLSDLSLGSYLVHEDHGIGRYDGIDQLEVQGVKKDYITIRYRDEDKLYIPVDQMNLIQKYIGSDSRKPKINKLNSGDWQKTKLKARQAVEDMAKDLLDLYAKRETLKGYKFSKDTPWQQEFEDMFPYEETQGQLESIKEIKKDMEKEKPMDRLLCGDVGFGKTEIALRAAFKAVMDGKQVAFLVPTTILAQQHYETMLDRFKAFPIKIDMLSRFKTKGQQDLVRENLKLGNIDIVVGTHRLLSKDVNFKDLGLLIIDEEQRFGVKDKEKIKQIKENVDVLILTATPIPRTLHMSLSGIRDMSLIEEPPAERFPIQTYVVEYNEHMIRDAILKEIYRGGQVYFVYNRVASIEKMASNLRKLVPEASFGVAHGQMGERQLEKEMMSFADGNEDVLVCTTIIETGLDIANVNTIIIYDADKMGLSQLYQLRGRVGRSNRIAYGYFTYEKDKVLTEVAEKRLRAIKEFTEFGSGFKIAMRDLEIRGAGNLLGSEQHGHIEAIGYDLYVKFLEQAVRRLKGEKIKKEVNTSIDLKVNGYIPDSYIGDNSQKIEIYKKVAAIDGREYYSELIDELIDRFGDMPKEVINLLDISYIKFLAGRSEIISINEDEKYINLEFIEENEFLTPKNIGDLDSLYEGSLVYDLSMRPKIKYIKDKKYMKDLKKIMEDIHRLNNS